MAYPAFWRRLCYALALALVITGWNLYIRTGYPKEWNTVRYGMQGSKVWSLCGKPTIGSEGMKADLWLRPLLFGQWEFRVYCGDVGSGRQSLVTGISLSYEWPILGTTQVKPDVIEIPIADYEAYERAFGFNNATSAKP